MVSVLETKLLKIFRITLCGVVYLTYSGFLEMEVKQLNVKLIFGYM